MLKLNSKLSLGFAVAVCFLNTLQGKNQVKVDDKQLIKQQADDLMEFIALANPWGNAIAEYSRKNGLELKIRCKNCKHEELNIGEFNGCMLAWVSKAMASGHETFQTVKALAEKFIQLLSECSPNEELLTFILNTANDLKQVCTNCHGVVWEK